MASLYDPLEERMSFADASAELIRQDIIFLPGACTLAHGGESIYVTLVARTLNDEPVIETVRFNDALPLPVQNTWVHVWRIDGKEDINELINRTRRLSVARSYRLRLEQDGQDKSQYNLVMVGNRSTHKAPIHVTSLLRKQPCWTPTQPAVVVS